MEPMVHIHFQGLQALRENITDSNVRQHSVFSYVPHSTSKSGLVLLPAQLPKSEKAFPC